MISEKLKGEELNAIQFIMDYLQVHFNSIGFTFFIWPKIYINNKTYEFGNIEYRNKLCEFIGKTVIDVSILEGEVMEVKFSEGERLQLNLDPNNPEIVGEIAIFWDEDGSCRVFE